MKILVPGSKEAVLPKPTYIQAHGELSAFLFCPCLQGPNPSPSQTGRDGSQWSQGKWGRGRCCPEQELAGGQESDGGGGTWGYLSISPGVSGEEVKLVPKSGEQHDVFTHPGTTSQSLLCHMLAGESGLLQLLLLQITSLKTQMCCLAVLKVRSPKSGLCSLQKLSGRICFLSFFRF